MKKTLLLVISLLIILTASGCSSGSNEITVASAGYTCSGTVNYGEDITANVTLQVTGGGLFSVIINSPDELKGLTFSFDNEELTLSYGNLVAEKLTVSDSFYGFADLLNGIFLKLTTGSPVAQKSGEAYQYEGQSDLYKFTVTVNENGFPTLISVPEAELTVTLNDWQY